MRFQILATLGALALGALVFTQPAPARADITWTIDPGHSLAEFSVVHLGVTHVRGSILIQQGSIVSASGDGQPTAISATLDASSIDTRNQDRDADLKSSNWLDVTKYPTLSFKSTNIVPGANGAFAATGDLTLHGVTRPVTLQGHVDGTTTDGRGHQRVAYSASTTIKRQDFGLNWAQQTPGGTFVAGDDVDISITIEAVNR
ncbi:MAG TPA: YceI family protein [Candidatus Eremiobacteraceae bacterium]|nr:YceI family protein [Candidatus Eremiobacteraceae bacterium]